MGVDVQILKEGKGMCIFAITSEKYLILIYFVHI